MGPRGCSYLQPRRGDRDGATRSVAPPGLRQPGAAPRSHGLRHGLLSVGPPGLWKRPVSATQRELSHWVNAYGTVRRGTKTSVLLDGSVGLFILAPSLARSGLGPGNTVPGIREFPERVAA
ncbi:hypothetical protein SBA2_150018 [Acidobacteriia bacterium SbA2]|nr:hypothetical protein SBA2_150018 [Acidobacteriia bacterium SbA2]